MIEDFKRMKWLPLTAGALLCAFGLFALLRPAGVAKMLSVCIGAVILTLGVSELAAGFAARNTQPRAVSGAQRLRGGVNVAVGLVFLLNRTLSLIFIAVTLGVWCILFGLMRLRDTLQRRAACRPWGGCAADAAAKLAIGAGMLASPLAGMAVWMIFIGLFFLFAGASVIYSALYLDRLPHDFGEF